MTANHIRELIKICADNVNEKNTVNVLNALKECKVVLPCTPQISKVDMARFAAEPNGEDVDSTRPLRLVPATVKLEDKYYIPVFTDKSQITQDFNTGFNTIEKPVTDIIKMAEKKDEYSGVVIDPFTQPFRLDQGYMDYVLKSL